jgi:uncharacterized membrane protein YidH (DUF202 family)
MSLSHHQQHQLFRIETGLLRADPRLAAMLAVFGKLSAGQAMPTWEQIPTRRDHIRHAAALTADAITLLAAAIGLLLSAMLALLIVVVQACRLRPPARRHDRAGPSHVTGGSDP